MRSFVLVMLFLLHLTKVGNAQSGTAAAIEQLANDPAMRHAGLGVCVLDVDSGKELAAYRSRQSLTPASSLKIVTTASALGILGGDFRFKTELQISGTIDADGTLRGNVYIKGYGDPTLGSDHFAKATPLETILADWVGALKAKGVRKIEGRVVGDASFFETAVNGRTWLWEDLGNYYASGAWGLNIHENRYFLKFQQNEKLGGQPKIVSVQPEVPNLMLINEVRNEVRGSGDNAYIFGAPFSYTRFVRGTIPVGSRLFTIKGSIPDPPFFAAQLLMNALEKNGVVTAKLATSQLELTRLGEAVQKRTTIHLHESPPLREIVRETNLKSVNLYCESMLKWIGEKTSGQRTTAAGLEGIKKFWADRGVDMNGFFMEDGSGLSPQNAVSAYHLASIMRKIRKDDRLDVDFYTSLPVGGQSGTLKGMFRNSAARGKIRAKSGGMTRVRSYTGYVKNGAGQELAFCVIANNFTDKSSAMRKRLERFMEALAK